MKPPKSQIQVSAFTLIELLVVIAIIAILAGLLMSVACSVEFIAGSTASKSRIRSRTAPGPLDQERQWPTVKIRQNHVTIVT